MNSFEYRHFVYQQTLLYSGLHIPNSNRFHCCLVLFVQNLNFGLMLPSKNFYRSRSCWFVRVNHLNLTFSPKLWLFLFFSFVSSQLHPALKKCVRCCRYLPVLTGPGVFVGNLQPQCVRQRCLYYTFD